MRQAARVLFIISISFGPQCVPPRCSSDFQMANETARKSCAKDSFHASPSATRDGARAGGI